MEARALSVRHSAHARRLLRRSIPFAGAAVLLAGAFALATEILSKREREGGSGAASGIFATGAIASLALALSLALEKGWLTVALALMVPGIAWVAEKRPSYRPKTEAAITKAFADAGRDLPPGINLASNR